MGTTARKFSKAHTAEQLWGVLHRSVSDVPNPLWACPFTGPLDGSEPRTEEREAQLRRELGQDLVMWRDEYEGCQDAAQLAGSAADTLHERLSEWLKTGFRPGRIPLQQHERVQLEALVEALERWSAELEDLEWPELPSEDELEGDLDGLVGTLGQFASIAEEIGNRVSEICAEVYAMEVPGVEVPVVLLEQE